MISLCPTLPQLTGTNGWGQDPLACHCTGGACTPSPIPTRQYVLGGFRETGAQGSQLDPQTSANAARCAAVPGPEVLTGPEVPGGDGTE